MEREVTSGRLRSEPPPELLLVHFDMMVSGPNSLVSMAHLCGIAAAAGAAASSHDDVVDAGLPRVWIRAG